MSLLKKGPGLKCGSRKVEQQASPFCALTSQKIPSPNDDSRERVNLSASEGVSLVRQYGGERPIDSVGHGVLLTKLSEEALLSCVLWLGKLWLGKLVSGHVLCQEPMSYGSFLGRRYH